MLCAVSLGAEVTGLIHEHAAPFDADEALLKMQQGKRWPRAEYVRANISMQAVRPLLPADAMPRDLSNEDLAELVQTARPEIENWPALMALLCMSDAEIKEAWHVHAGEASNAGTWMHAMLEHVFNGYNVMPGCMASELQTALHCMSPHAHLRAYRTEWTIFAERESLAGSIDLVLQDPVDGGLVLVDWKRSAKLDQKYESFGRYMRGPLESIPDCQGWHYKLQLNAYKWIIESYYQQKVKGMFVVCAHPNFAPDGFVDTVPDLSDTMSTLMHARRALVQVPPLPPSPSLRLPDTQDEELGRAFMSACPCPTGLGAQLDAPPATAALSQQDVNEVLDALVEDAEEGVPQQARARRLIRGAADTQQRFACAFSSHAETALSALEGVQSDEKREDDSALQTSRRMLSFVREQHPEWSEDLARLATVAAHVCQARLGDRMMLPDSACLLWMIEGERHIRVHRGFCHIYDDNGAFVPYGGTPPEAVLGRLQKFFGVLEGVFRRVSGSIRRRPDATLLAIAQDRQSFESEEQFFKACLEAALCQQGGPSEQARLDAPEDEHEETLPIRGARGVAGAEPWTLCLAKKLWRVSQSLRSEMMSTRLISLIVEWCETPDQRRGCVAYADACVRYDARPDLPTCIVRKSPANDCYVSIPHRLLDPVLADCEARLCTFYSQTFWCNNELFLCNQAAIALAKRGLNIDRCFIGQSPGGVGQSLYSQHLAEMFKQNHCFFDPNVWHNEEELRKQVESFARCCICTGQEAPESHKKLHTDLYKKTMSADGITGRKPYGYTTRMFSITGWKRLETNRLMHFSGVTAANFNSILRRSLVWKPKARFLNAKFLMSYPDHATDGFFVEDPTLSRFLASSQASAAGLRLQHGFEVLHSKDQCYQMIEEYAAGGGDEYLTEDSMRAACGLPLRQRHVEAQPAVAQFGLEAGSQQEKDDGVRAWSELRDFLVTVRRRFCPCMISRNSPCPIATCPGCIRMICGKDS